MFNYIATMRIYYLALMILMFQIAYSQECGTISTSNCQPGYITTYIDSSRYDFKLIGFLGRAGIYNINEIWICDENPSFRIWMGEVEDLDYCLKEYLDTIFVENDSLLCTKREYDYKAISSSIKYKSACNQYDTLPGLNDDVYMLIQRDGETYTNVNESVNLNNSNPFSITVIRQFKGKKCGIEFEKERKYELNECGNSNERDYPCYEWITKKSHNKR